METIPDEWLEDIRRLAERDVDGFNVTMSRRALRGLLVRLDVAERRAEDLKWGEPLLGRIQRILAQAVNQLPLPDGPLLPQFRLIHEQMRGVLEELNKLDLKSEPQFMVTCLCGLTVTKRSTFPGGSHYGHKGPKQT